MRSIRPKGPFRRDVKRLKRRGWDIGVLDTVIQAIQRDDALPAGARPHLLQGERLGYRERHLANDWLLIYKVNSAELLLARTGTHADLFE